MRLVLNLDAAATVTLHPSPYDGQRLAVLDAGQTLATNNLTLDANGRRIEGQQTLMLDTDGDTREWLYRADLGNWVKMGDLALGDDLPFPSEFDDYFSIVLAMRLSPRYGQAIAPPSTEWLQAMSNQLEARYRKPRPPQDIPSRALLGGSKGSFGNPQSFYTGRPWW